MAEYITVPRAYGLGHAWENMMVKISRLAPRSILLGATALLLASGAASAQTFSFTTTSDTPTAVGTSNGAVTVGAAYWTGATETTMADGTVMSSTSTCVSMLQPANSGLFASHGVCDGTGESGTYTAYMGCNPMNAEGTEMTCVGGLIGTGGDFEGRGGSFTMHVKDGAGTGAGLWRE